MRLPNLSIKCPNDLPNRVCECMKTSVNHSQKWREVVESLKAETVVRAEGIVRDRPDEDINKVLLKYMSYLHIYTCILSFLHIVLPHIWMQFYQFSFIFLFFSPPQGMPTGAIEVHLETLEVLNEAHNLPFSLASKAPAVSPRLCEMKGVSIACHLVLNPSVMTQ